MSDSDKQTADNGSLCGLFDHTPETLRELVVSLGAKPFRAGQILEWVFKHGAQTYEDMTNLPKSLRGQLVDCLPLFHAGVTSRLESKDGTIKLLLTWPDAATSECVLIPDRQRQTACVSTQVGCPVGCAFCASGLDGLQRQLTAGEIVEQAMHVRLLLEPSRRLSNVVLMGLGEPLANYDATVRAVRTINADWGMGIGARKITVSTVGLPQQMRRLAEEDMQITLALSLHAPTDELRAHIIPWAKNGTIAELIEAAAYYFDRTGREVTIEYILLGGLNDGKEHARKLAKLCNRLRSNVNLIRYNPVPNLPHKRPTDQTVHVFRETLASLGVNVNLRSSRGLDIEAACGQLRRRQQLGEPE